MDVTARARLVAEINKQSGEIAVPLELFFGGNDDRGSMGCNLGNTQPSIQEFYERFRELRSRPEVQDVWVRITDATDPNSWPFSDTVYVISSLPQDEIERLQELLQFTEVSAGWMYGKPDAAPEASDGLNTYSLWWD